MNKMYSLSLNLKILVDSLGKNGLKEYLRTIEDEKIETIEELNDILETEISYMSES